MVTIIHAESLQSVRLHYRRPNEITTIASFTTAADRLNTWPLHQDTSLDEPLSGGTDITLSIRAEKTVAPGNLFLSGPAVFVT